MTGRSFPTFAHLVRHRAGELGGARALSLWEGGDFVDLSWEELWAGACRVANTLAWLGLEPGDHLLLLATDTRPAVLVQLGAWARGCSTTQVGLPFRLTDIAGFVADLGETAATLGAKAIVVSRALGDHLDPAAAPLPVLLAEDLVQGPDDPIDLPDSARAPALVQLTSGSTGRPRGVEIPHDRLLLHLGAISAVLPATPGSSGVTWLPLHHDMGMIGGLLYALYNRLIMHIMTPLEFRGRPMRWLEALSRTRATHTLGPPSAYALCLRLAPRAVEAGLDLSGLTCAMVGAEPISAGLLRAFADAFAPCGFRPEAFFPVYGLAEATVAATFPSPMSPTRFDRVSRSGLEVRGRAEPAEATGGRAEPAEATGGRAEPADGHPLSRARAGEAREIAGSSDDVSTGSSDDLIELVGVGRALPGSEVRIVDPAGLPMPDRTVGEIEVRGPTLMTGYRGDPEATAAALHDGWLRTGDLGYLEAGTLFVTGRKKEVIIKGGRNLMPAVLEEIVSAVPGIRPGCVAAIGLRSESLQTEQVWVVAETKEPAERRPDLERRVHTALQRRGFVADQLRLVDPGTLPKTTSGKVRRLELAAGMRP